MGACQSKRDTIPADSIHVMLGVSSTEELKRRYSQEDHCSIDNSFRPSSLDQLLDTFHEQDVKHRRTRIKRATMETSVCSLDSVEVEEVHDDTSSMPRGLVDKVNSSRSCTALIEPKPTLSQGSLAA